jgi:hypothetical protein
VAGFQVLEGRLSQTSYVRLTRDQRVLWSGRALAGPAAANVVMASFVAAIALLGVGVSVVAAGSITAGRMVAGALATGRWGRVAAAGGLLGLVTLSGVAEIAVVATVFPNPTPVR